jgi:hypothetical protein
LQAQGRFFAVDIQAEDQFLRLMDHLRELAAAAELYRVVTGVCCMLLVFDLLGAFRFQPRLGLITRTLEVKKSSA